MATRLKIEFLSEQGNPKVCSAVAQASETETEEQAIVRAKAVLRNIYSKVKDNLTDEEFDSILTIEQIV